MRTRELVDIIEDYVDDELDDEYEDELEEDLFEDDNDDYDDAIEEFGRKSRRWLDSHSEDEEDKTYSDESPEVPIMLSGKEMEELKGGRVSKQLFDKIQLKRELTCIHKMNNDQTWKGIQKEVSKAQGKLENKTYKIIHRGIYG